MKTKNKRSFIAWLALAAIAGETNAGAVILPVAEDAYSTATHVTNTISATAGGSTTLAVASNHQAFVRFDLSALPAFMNATNITLARLTLYVTKATTRADLTVQLVTSDWHETNRTIKTPSIGNGLTATIPLAEVATRKFVVVDVTAALVAWANGTNDFGFAITTATGNLTLASKEGAATGYPATLEVEAAGGTFTGSQTFLADGGNVKIVGTTLGTGGASRSAIDLLPFDESPNDPQTRIQATDDGGFGAHLDFLTKPIGSSANALTQRMRITSDGNVGIGTTTPVAGLQVETVGAVSAGTWSFFQRGIIATNSFSGTPNLAIYTSGGMGASTYYAFSDARIKNIIGVSSGSKDLDTLRAIQVTDFTYRDVVMKGNGPVKKVIAQQVESVYPQAVSRSAGVVPDIYQNATLKEGWVHLTSNLKVGERVKLVSENGQGIYPVLEIQNGAFRTDFKSASEQVFVFGREVKDFRNVDYEAIAMLNVSATQELARKLEAKNAEFTKLQAENSALAEKFAALEARDQAREARLARLEKALNQDSAALKVNRQASTRELSLLEQ